MKKTVFYFVLLAGIAMSLSSCHFLIPATYKMVVDENVPADQTVMVTFVNDQEKGWFELREWNNGVNGKKIKDELYGNWGGVGSNEDTRLTVPAGTNSFIFNLYFTRAGNPFYYPFENMEIRYDLEQGKEYLIKGITKSLDSGKGYELFVGIFDVTDRKELLLKEWKLR